ncbi:HD-GYP domain-containing protein [Tumebacillus sp. DT12]|uniref:HD-GYP domain-containing protein n=1 Tax=Tumebacillus lacus TaxID=2995335 RepID=A0ABT3X6T8_9BACL|nr:HD-GYP domain-containing protein [Tumebacillus lacus]MCX7570454.1 HD-GYP domain-containing protein [Tumebacillus lacus]
MEAYKVFVRHLIRNYVLGSLVAIFCVAGFFGMPILQIAREDAGLLSLTLALSTVSLLVVEIAAFRRQLRPIRDFFGERPRSAEQFMKVYLYVHRMPLMAVKRIFGPHLLGFLVPAVAITVWQIEAGILDLSFHYIYLALIGSGLMAGMHAVVEFFLTAEAIQPLLNELRGLATREFAVKDVKLDGNVIVSINRKFTLSALLIGTFPLFLFSFAAQLQFQEANVLVGDYWRWAATILVLGIAFAALSAWLMARAVHKPIDQLENLMADVQKGQFDVRATDLYSDEFSRLVTGFNLMVDGLARRDALNSQLMDSYFATLAAALDARDPYTAGHSIRVANFSVQIGKQGGLGVTELDLLRKSALLHDIGKIGIRDSVLLKEGKLTDEEFDQIKMHPAMGEAILRQIQPHEAMAPLLPGVRSHHERYDGRGYPDGLAGEEIPLFGRIIAVADAFDAMTSDRPYRKGMPVDKALSILEEGRGTQWDPAFVETFVNWVRAQEGSLEKKFDHLDKLERVM